MVGYKSPFPTCFIAARDDVASTFENRSVVLDVLSNDKVAAGKPIIQKLGGGMAKPGDIVAQQKTPYGLLQLKLTADRRVVFVPCKALEALRAGELFKTKFTYSIVDSAGQHASAAVNLTIKGVNDGPKITGPVGPVRPIVEWEDAHAQDIAPITGTILVTDHDKGDLITGKLVGAASLAYSGGTLPAGIDISALSAPGALTFGSVASRGGTHALTWTYDPKAVNLDFLAAGERLTVTFQYRVTDGQAHSPIQTIKVTIVGTNDGPVARNDCAATDEDQSVTIDVRANDTDLDRGDVLTITSVSDGAHGKVSVDGSGKIIYTPDANYAGEDTFTYTVRDKSGAESTATVKVTVAPVDDGVILNVPQAGEAGTQVAESGLAGRSGEPAGSDAAAQTELTAGTIAFTAVDGFGSIEIGGHPVALGHAMQTVFTDATGRFTVTDATFDPATGAGTISYTYELLDNTVGLNTVTVPVIVVDADGTTASSSLVVSIVDDAPKASDDLDSIEAGSLGPATGNVLSGGSDGVDANVTDGMADVTGADGAAVTKVAHGVHEVSAGADGTLLIDGDYGVLTLHQDGSYSYARDPGSKGGVADVFTYTLTDADGSASSATLTVAIGNSTPLVTTSEPGQGGTRVSEAGLPARAPGNEGTGEAAGPLPNDDPSETASGVVSFVAHDGVQSISIGDVVLTPADIVATTVGDAHGALTITSYSYDAATGQGSIGYTYTLGTNAIGDAKATFAIGITDTDGQVGAATLTVDIADDRPILAPDQDAVPGGSHGPATGNVLTGHDDGGQSDANASDGQADVLGADGGSVTGIRSDNLTGPQVAVGTAGTTVDGEHGRLTIKSDGSYAYALFDSITTVASFVSEESAFANVMGVKGSLAGGSSLAEEQSATATYKILPAEASANYFALVNAEADHQAVRYFAVLSDGSELLVHNGAPDAFTFAAVFAKAKELGTTTFLLKFDDLGGNVDFNDFVARIDIAKAPIGQTDVFSYTVTDGDGDTATATLTFGIEDAAPVANNVAAAGDEDLATPIVIAGSDVDLGDRIETFTLLTLPEHGTLLIDGVQAEVGVAYAALGNALRLSFQPDHDWSGATGFTFKGSDGELDSNTATATITIGPVNDAPVAGNDAATTEEDKAVTIAVLDNDTDIDGGTLAIACVTQGQHGSVTINGDGTVTYTPDDDFYSSDAFTYTVSDGKGGTDVATVRVGVNPVNDAPAAADDAYTTTEDQALVVPAAGILSNDTDVDGDALHPILLSGPAHGSLKLNTDGSFTYTPDADFNGIDSFTYEAGDGIADSNSATVTIRVTAANDAPSAAGDAYTTTEDHGLAVNAKGVLLNDADIDGDALAAVVVAGPAHGHLTLNADGSFTYVPDSDYNGTDSFTYKANDGKADSNVATVTIAVTPVNDAPKASNDGYVTSEDQALSIPKAGVLVNDTDVDGDAITAIIVGGPSHGTLSLNADGSFLYTPDADFNGTDAFTYRASDGASQSDIATVSINVGAVNDAPVVQNTHLWVATDPAQETSTAPGYPNGYPVLIGRPTDVDGDVVTMRVAGTVPAGLKYFDGTSYVAVTSGMVLFATGTVNLLDKLVYQPTGSVTDTPQTTLSLDVSDGTVHVTQSVAIHEVSAASLPSDTAVIGNGEEPLNSGRDYTATVSLSKATVDGILNNPAGSTILVYTDFQKQPNDLPVPLSEQNPTTFTDSNSPGTAREKELQIELKIGSETFVIVERDSTSASFEQSWFLDSATGFMKATASYSQIQWAGHAGKTLADYLADHTPSVGDAWTVVYNDSTGGNFQGRNARFEFYTKNPGDPSITVAGTADADMIYGTSGNDTLAGGSGADVIEGRGGADTVTGGDGSDLFHYLSTFESNALSFDTIKDFTAGSDRIDLFAIDAKTQAGFSGNDAFAFVSAPTGALQANAVTWFQSGGNTFVQADTDGNTATAELKIKLAGLVTLTAADFVL